MSDFEQVSAAVWAEYDGKYRPKQVNRVCTASAFSGAAIWRCETEIGPLCLRKWPTRSPSKGRLHWIHDVIRRAAEAGFTALPVPIATRSGATFVAHDEHLWELAPWLPGECDHPSQPAVISSPERIAAAASALARFHDAVASAFAPLAFETPPGLIDRVRQLTMLRAGGLDTLVQSVAANQHRWPELAKLSERLFGKVRPLLDVVTDRAQPRTLCRVAVQPCVRDIHREHVLFSGERVTGIVDFGAMRIDTVAGDLARLLASMAMEGEKLWAVGVAAYEQVRTISDDERRLIVAYHETSVLLSGIQWLRWVFVDQKEFENHFAVEERFEVILAKLTALAVRLPISR